jgi:hypothetical protein
MFDNDTYFLMKEAAEITDKTVHTIRHLVFHNKVRHKKNQQGRVMVSVKDLILLYPKITAKASDIERLIEEASFLKDQIREKDKQISFYQQHMNNQSMIFNEQGSANG